MDYSKVYEVLYGNRMQGGRYQKAVCLELTDALIQRGYLTQSQLCYSDTVAECIEHMLTDYVQGTKCITHPLFTLLVGVADERKLQGGDPSKLRVERIKDMPELPRYSFNVVDNTTVTQTVTLTYKEMAQNLVKAYADEHTLPFGTKDTVQAFSGMLAIKGTPIGNIGDTIDAMRKILVCAPKSVLDQCEDDWLAAVYTYAVSEGMDIPSTSEVVKLRAHMDATHDLLKNTVHLQEMEVILFGKQKQGAFFRETLTAITMAYLMSKPVDWSQPLRMRLLERLSSERPGKRIPTMLNVLTGGELWCAIRPNETNKVSISMSSDGEKGKYRYSAQWVDDAMLNCERDEDDK